MWRTIASCVVPAALAISAATHAASSDSVSVVKPIPVVALSDVLPHAAHGRWVTRVQLVWNEETRELNRRALTVWSNFSDDEMDFLWLPDGGGVPQTGRVAGTGRLIWRQRNTSTADRSAIIGVFRGALVNGKAHGDGAFFHAIGITYEGAWLDGLMHGEGHLTSPLGTVFSGRFERGVPHGDSELSDAFGHSARLRIDEGRVAPGGHAAGDSGAGPLADAAPSPPLARASPAPSEFGADQNVPRADLQDRGIDGVSLTLVQNAAATNVRVGVFVAPPLPTESWMDPLKYKGVNRGNALFVQPEDATLVRAWLGQGDDTNVPGVSDDAQGLMWGGARWDAPVEFRIAVRNDSTRQLKISGGQLRVKESTPVVNPLVNIDVGGRPPGCRDPYSDAQKLEASIHDSGWGTIDDSQMTVQIGTLRKTAPATARAHIGAVGGYRNRVDLTDAFAQLGLDANFCRIIHSCDTRSLGLPDDVARETADPQIARCFAALQLSGRLGDNAALIEGHGGNVSTQFVATYSYQWRDHTGRQRTSSRIFEKYLNLTDLYYQGYGAEAGEAEPFKGNSVELKAQGQDYAVRVPLRATVKAGEEKSWSVLIAAPRSSFHELVFELQTSAQRISSRPVSLLYYLPNLQRYAKLNPWQFEDLNARAPMVAAGQRWIQLASRRTPDEATRLACQLKPRLSSGGIEDTERGQQPAIFRSMNDWYAIVAGPFGEREVASRLDALKRSRAIPADSLVVDGQRFINPLESYWCQQ